MNKQNSPDLLNAELCIWSVAASRGFALPAVGAVSARGSFMVWVPLAAAHTCLLPRSVFTTHRPVMASGMIHSESAGLRFCLLWNHLLEFIPQQAFFNPLFACCHLFLSTCLLFPARPWFACLVRTCPASEQLSVLHGLSL